MHVPVSIHHVLHELTNEVSRDGVLYSHVPLTGGGKRSVLAIAEHTTTISMHLIPAHVRLPLTPLSNESTQFPPADKTLDATSTACFPNDHVPTQVAIL